MLRGIGFATLFSIVNEMSSRLMISTLASNWFYHSSSGLGNPSKFELLCSEAGEALQSCLVLAVVWRSTSRRS